jgi:hypothetical protein
MKNLIKKVTSLILTAVFVFSNTVPVELTAYAREDNYPDNNLSENLSEDLKDSEKQNTPDSENLPTDENQNTPTDQSEIGENTNDPGEVKEGEIAAEAETQTGTEEASGEAGTVEGGESAEEPKAPDTKEETPTAEETAEEETDKTEKETDDSADSNTQTEEAPRRDSTGKVELKIARLQDGVLEEIGTDWYTQQVVDSVADIDISGNDFIIEEPSLVIRLPKTDKITDVHFVDSRAGKTERYEDEDYFYVKYTYERLTGGTHYTYPFYFTFDGHHAKDGDSIDSRVTLYDKGGNILKDVTQTYIARTVGFELWSVHGNSGLGNRKTTVTENGHDYVVDGRVNTLSDTKTYPGEYTATNVFATIYPKKVEGIDGNVGIEYPKNLKIVYTYPKDEPKFRERPQNPHHVRSGEKYTVTQDDNVYTFIIQEPNFSYFDANLGFVTNNRYATTASSVMAADNVTVNTRLPIKIDFYKNVNEDGTGGEYLGTRVEAFTFNPVP